MFQATEETLLVPDAKARKQGKPYNRRTRQKGLKGERVAEGTVVLMNRVMPGEERAHTISATAFNKKESRDEMTKASIGLQDLRGRIYDKANTGPINFVMKLVGKPGAGKPHAGFDAAGTGDRAR